MIIIHLVSPDYCTYREVQSILKRAAVLHVVQISRSPCSLVGLNRNSNNGGSARVIIGMMECRHMQQQAQATARSLPAFFGSVPGC